jgi:hypothetical protein
VARRHALGLVLAGAGLLCLAGSASAGGNAQARQAIVAPPTYPLQPWGAETDNLVRAQGSIELDGSPVTGVRVRVDNYDLAAPTDAGGRFFYLVDHTLLARHVVTVTDTSNGKLRGQPLTSSDASTLKASRAAISVAYAIKELKVSRDGSGRPVVTGRLVDGVGATPPAVGLLTYQLTGTVTGSDGKPVSGAQVSTRTLDRDYWTVSTTTDARGFYSSLFTASAEAPGNPVPFTIRISKGDTVYQYLSQEFVYFQRLQSARLDIRLPPRGYALALPRPQSYPGAIYTGTVAGVTFHDTVVRPVAATWLDDAGRFRITLPQKLAGKTVALWEAKLNLFSRPVAKPGAAIDLVSYPATLPPEAPRNLVQIPLK